MDYLDPEPRTNLQHEIILKINEIINKMGPDKLNEWQLCPKCNGHGVIHFITMDMHSIDTTSKPCDLCNGKKIISKIDGNPPK